MLLTVEGAGPSSKARLSAFGLIRVSGLICETYLCNHTASRTGVSRAVIEDSA